MMVNVPAQIVVPKIIIIFGPRSNDMIQSVEAEIACLAQLTPQDGIISLAPKCPYGVHKWQASQFIPGCSQVPNFVVMGGTQQVKRRVANQQSKLGEARWFVIRKRFELRL